MDLEAPPCVRVATAGEAGAGAGAPSRAAAGLASLPRVTAAGAGAGTKAEAGVPKHGAQCDHCAARDFMIDHLSIRVRI